MDMGLVVFLFFVAILVTVMARASRFAPVSTISEPVEPPTPPSPPVPLRRAAIRQAEHRYRMERLARKRHTENPELAKLKTENQRLQNQLHDITAGQLKGIDLFLEAERTKKPLTRTAVTLLLGKDKSAGLQAIRDREPLPEEIARPEPIPA